MFILNRADCVFKVEAISEDAFKLSYMGMVALERLMRFPSHSLLQNEPIPQNVCCNLFTPDSFPGILYSLPKVQKSNRPARPILLAMCT